MLQPLPSLLLQWSLSQVCTVLSLSSNWSLRPESPTLYSWALCPAFGCQYSSTEASPRPVSSGVRAISDLWDLSLPPLITELVGLTLYSLLIASLLPQGAPMYIYIHTPGYNPSPLLEAEPLYKITQLCFLLYSYSLFLTTTLIHNSCEHFLPTILSDNSCYISCSWIELLVYSMCKLSFQHFFLQLHVSQFPFFSLHLPLGLYSL